MTSSLWNWVVAMVLFFCRFAAAASGGSVGTRISEHYYYNASGIKYIWGRS